MRRAVAACAVLAACIACAKPEGRPSQAAVPTSTSAADAQYPHLAGLPPGRHAPPAPPLSSDTALVTDRVEDAFQRFDQDRWERFFDAMDPGELSSDLRLSEDQITKGLWRKSQLFRNGDELFDHDFTVGEGFGPGHFRIERGDTGGPDALSCSECHHRGGPDGAGDRSQNAFFDGDGRDPSSAFERNPPNVLGLGIVQRLAEEMTASLERQRDAVVAKARFTKQPASILLEAKGVSFGTLTADPGGTLDSTQLAGIDGDLVVKPFGWKGSMATLRDFVIDGFQRHHGIQFPRRDGPGTGPEWDRDKDGSPNELSDGMLISVVAYLCMLDVPVMIPPREPDLLARHSHGREILDSAGCSACHVPSLPLEDPRMAVSPGLTLDLLAEGEAPRPKNTVDVGPTPIFLYSDLRRHRMGAELAEARPTAHGIPADEFLTRPLWGLAETAPYLHDGRAITLDDAILAHGGEAKESRNRFARLSASDKADLRIFLLSLTRYPRIEYR